MEDGISSASRMLALLLDVSIMLRNYARQQQQLVLCLLATSIDYRKANFRLCVALGASQDPDRRLVPGMK